MALTSPTTETWYPKENFWTKIRYLGDFKESETNIMDFPQDSIPSLWNHLNLLRTAINEDVS